MITTTIRHLYRRIKQVEPESWIIAPKDAHRQVTYRDYEHLKPVMHQEIKKTYNRKR